MSVFLDRLISWRSAASSSGAQALVAQVGFDGLHLRERGRLHAAVALDDGRVDDLGRDRIQQSAGQRLQALALGGLFDALAILAVDLPVQRAGRAASDERVLVSPALRDLVDQLVEGHGALGSIG